MRVPAAGKLLFYQEKQNINRSCAGCHLQQQGASCQAWERAEQASKTGCTEHIYNMELIGHLWPLPQKHLHFNRKQAKDFALYLRTECSLELFRQQAVGSRSSEKKLQITLWGRKSVYCSVSKNSVCLLAAFVSYKNTGQKAWEHCAKWNRPSKKNKYCMSITQGT